MKEFKLYHSGGLDQKGGHTNRKTGEYHIHRKKEKEPLEIIKPNVEVLEEPQLEITELRETTVDELSKSQMIRLIDVFLIAPVCIYAGTIKTLPKWLRVSLIGIGAATAYYNGKNYLDNKK